MKNSTTSLIKQLQEFGLNPNCWIIKRLRYKHKWIIIHKKDCDLLLLGQTAGEKKWNYLEWLI